MLVPKQDRNRVMTGRRPADAEPHLVGGVLVQHEGEHLLLELLVGPALVLAAVDEDVVLAGVRVQVAVHDHAALLHQPATVRAVIRRLRFREG